MSATLIDLAEVLELLDECEKRVGYSLQPLRCVAEVAAASSARIENPWISMRDEPEREPCVSLYFRNAAELLSVEIVCERDGLIFRMIVSAFGWNRKPSLHHEIRLRHEDDARAAELCVRLLTGGITEEQARKILERDE